MRKEKETELKLGINTTDTFTAANGESAAYQDIFEGILTNIRCFAATSGKRIRKEDLEDMAQDAFLKAVLYGKSFNPDKCRKPQDFGNRIAENCKVDALNSISRHDATFTDVEFRDEDGDEFAPTYISGYRGDEYEADKEVEMKETEELVCKAIETLSKDYQEVLYLSLQGYKTGEIAEQLGIEPGIAYTRLSRAKAALRKVLREEYGDEFGL